MEYQKRYPHREVFSDAWQVPCVPGRRELRIYGAGSDCYAYQFCNGSDAEFLHEARTMVVHRL